MLVSRAQLRARIMGALGGRAAEDVVFGHSEVTTGAGGDIQQVASMARQMVTRFGMSELGPMSLESGNQEVFLGRDLMTRSDVSDAIGQQDRRCRSPDRSELLRRNRQAGGPSQGLHGSAGGTSDRKGNPRW